jgi:hypothetical protein
VLPVPFAQIACPENHAWANPPQFNLDWLPERVTSEVAFVVDLPGSDAIYYGLALAERGCRPIPVIDGSPGPDHPAPLGLDFSLSGRPTAKSASVVDMRGLLLALCHGGELLRHARLESGSPPAFLLDSHRMKGPDPESRQVFDNRWMAFPQDFPSGLFLRKQGIRKVVLVHDTFSKEPSEDLAHVLLRWQEDGIAVESKSARFGDTPIAIKVSRPSRFRRAWYRFLAALGLRRNDAGGFGGYPPEPSSAG